MSVDPKRPWSDEVEASYRHCREVTRERAGNFHYGIRLFPEPKRSAIYAMYAWSRVGDDLADSERDANERAAEVRRFGELTRSQLDGGDVASGGEHWPAFIDACGRFPIERSAIDDMLDGLEQDTHPVRLERWADLDAYCDRVAASVGRMCVSIWGPAFGVDPASMREPAIMRGRAFQLVNILRDVAEDHDAEPRRVYLPTEAFEEVGLTPEQLRTWSEPGRCRRLVEQVAAAARHRFDRSAALETLVDPTCVPGLVAMTRVYRGILDRIERAPAAVVGTRRVGLPAWEKTGIALRAAASRVAAGMVGVRRP
ncbi:MAG: phytoene/squalene synthase family protein [Planctomycetota bacterium]